MLDSIYAYILCMALAYRMYHDIYKSTRRARLSEEIPHAVSDGPFRALPRRIYRLPPLPPISLESNDSRVRYCDIFKMIEEHHAPCYYLWSLLARNVMPTQTPS